MFKQKFTKEELRNEIWKPIFGFEDRYKISNLGRLMGFRKCPDKGKLISLFLNNGYVSTKLYKDGVKYHRRIHQLVAEAFICSRPPDMTVNHINGVKTDNRHKNLEYLTQADNTQHAKNMGLYKSRKSRKYSLQRAAYYYQRRIEREEKLLILLLIRKCLRESSKMVNSD